MADEPTRVALVDDHALFREGLRELLEAEDDVVVVGEAGDSTGAVALAEREQPHVILLDVEIPGCDVTTTVTTIRSIAPRTQIIIVSMYDGPQLVQSLLAAGIRGYLLKSVHRDELLSAIRGARAGIGGVTLAVSRVSLAMVTAQDGPSLSERECEVLELAAQALTNTQIARRLHLSTGTVKRHLHNIFVKLKAVSRIDAVNKAAEARLINPDRIRQRQQP